MDHPPLSNIGGYIPSIPPGIYATDYGMCMQMDYHFILQDFFFLDFDTGPELTLGDILYTVTVTN